jgi:N-acetylglucosaminyldiphosphoundecaprenol N-acetyl-beta-D-mannosaminyltransferase
MRLTYRQVRRLAGTCLIDYNMTAAFDKIQFLGINFTDMEMAEAQDAIVARAGQDRFSYVVTPNVDHVVKLNSTNHDTVHAEYALAYANADLILCDSRILKRLASLSRIILPLIPGSDLTKSMFESRFEGKNTIAIIGGNTELLVQLEKMFPLPCYFHFDPPMGVLRNVEAQEAVVSFVAQTQADYVLFAIGSPQSEILAYRCAQDIGCRGLGLCIGASIEFITAHKRRAPRWMQAAGLEWAFRLASEPKRLWRRYLVEGPRIFLIYAQWHAKG